MSSLKSSNLKHFTSEHVWIGRSKRNKLLPAYFSSSPRPLETLIYIDIRWERLFFHFLWKTQRCWGKLLQSDSHFLCSLPSADASRVWPLTAFSPSSHKVHNPVKTAFEMIPQAEHFLLLFFFSSLKFKSLSQRKSLWLPSRRMFVLWSETLNLTLTCFVQGFRIIIFAVGADSINIRQSVFTANTVWGLVSLLTLGLDPNFDSIYKVFFFPSLGMCSDSQLSDHPASNSLWWSSCILDIVFLSLIPPRPFSGVSVGSFQLVVVLRVSNSGRLL